MEGISLAAPTGSLRGPNSASMSGFQSESIGTNDMSTSPDGGQSDRPTPNSSSASDRQNLNTGRMSSGGNSFETSPVTQTQNVSQSDVDRNVAAFFNDPTNGFSMGTGMTPDQRFTMPDTPGGEFTVPPGWELPGQTGMTPVAEGVLRTIMQMGPMETMDLGWDHNP
ncbi:putative binuclear zinc transcription factor protein [Phaeoacremonium minimum UCRPA7]|uniref:Putative binuclear zinc transcription factor protein n=1 Tax=Phaeoacremonium minimum (strain UCR-PA7) TaxID=1286976 RepID=R8BF24_PHAM7|nr:putative binuclear zinc transcription factor protein [Phaeoacremonium minimum UCRPA7]EON97892.1 putative binuclear zinc transcription factor protein [Phaeoacremonium minimum UCRPA7]